MIPDAPYVRLMIQAAALARTGNYITNGGLAAGTKVTVRHARFRNSISAEKPCITFLFVGDEPMEDETQHNAWEVVRELTMDMMIDMDIPAEDSELDPTGFAMMGRQLAVAYATLSPPGSGNTALGGMADFVRPGSIDPADNNTSDNGRLVRGISVLYRVRSDDPNVLLSAGENG
jgi:hypothetical protein